MQPSHLTMAKDMAKVCLFGEKLQCNLSEHKNCSITVEFIVHTKEMHMFSANKLLMSKHFRLYLLKL